MIINYTDTIKIRISDINYGNHLGHTQLINLLHEIRLQFLKKNGLNEHDIDGNALVMRDLNVKYINQAFWDNEIEINMQLQNAGIKIIFTYDVNNLTLNNKTAEIITVMLLVDKKTFRPLKPNLLMETFSNGTTKAVNFVN